MKALTPVQSLLFLILAGATIAGWAYGLHWKRIASGDLFTSDEQLMIRLQDQISALSEENESLHKRIRELGGSELETDPSQIAESTGPLELPVLPSQPGPVLPAPAQKIETH